MRCEPAENSCASPDKEEMRSYMKKILIHGSGHKASSWEKTVAHMENRCDILCPELCSLLNGKTASYANLYDSFVRYCNAIDGPDAALDCRNRWAGSPVRYFIGRHFSVKLRLGLPGENENIGFDRHAVQNPKACIRISKT